MPGMGRLNKVLTTRSRRALAVATVVLLVVLIYSVYGPYTAKQRAAADLLGLTFPTVVSGAMFADGGTLLVIIEDAKGRIHRMRAHYIIRRYLPAAMVFGAILGSLILVPLSILYASWSPYSNEEITNAATVLGVRLPVTVCASAVADGGTTSIFLKDSAGRSLSLTHEGSMVRYEPDGSTTMLTPDSERHLYRWLGKDRTEEREVIAPGGEVDRALLILLSVSDLEYPEKYCGGVEGVIQVLEQRIATKTELRGR